MHEHGACRLTPPNHHSHALPFTWLRPSQASRIPEAIAVGSTEAPSKAKPAPSDAKSSTHLLFTQKQGRSLGYDLAERPACPKQLPSGLRKHQARPRQHRRKRKAAHIYFFRKNKAVHLATTLPSVPHARSNCRRAYGSTKQGYASTVGQEKQHTFTFSAKTRSPESRRNDAGASSTATFRRTSQNRRTKAEQQGQGQRRSGHPPPDLGSSLPLPP